MSLEKITVGVDMNGGDWINNDHPSKRLLLALDKYQNSSVKFVLYGNKEEIAKNFPKNKTFPSFFYVDAPNYFENIRTIKRSPRSEKLSVNRESTSLVKLLDDLNSEKLDVGISMHETSSLIFYSERIVGKIDNVPISVPPLMTMLPSKKGFVLLTDIGATSDTKPEELAAFGLLASAYLKSINLRPPKVKILSNGSEKKKGNDLAKQTAKILETYNDQGLLLFDKEIPYVEGHIGLFEGECDIALTDGHTGNILIKFVKGFKDFINHEVKSTANNPSGLKDYGVLLGLGTAKAFYKNSSFEESLDKFNTAKYNGAPLLGLNKYMLKLQGNSSVEEIVNGISKAIEYKQSNVIESIRNNF